MRNSFQPSLTRQKCLILFFCFYSLVCFIPLFGQGGVEMTKPYLMIVNDTLIIRYGFVGSKPWDVFNVRLEITDSAGKVIPARSFSGDIGDSIYGGQQKIILWNMAADNIFINQNLYVEVISEKLDAVPMPVLQTVPADSLQGRMADSGPVKNNDESIADEKEESYNKAMVPHKKNNVLFSALVPGWGLTRLYDGKPYWLIGVAGFGCIATSVFFNRQAVSSYDRYMESYDPAKYKEYFGQAEEQYLTSNILGYSALAIWVIDLGITILCAERVQKSLYTRYQSRISVGSGYQYNINTSFVSLNYRF